MARLISMPDRPRIEISVMNRSGRSRMPDSHCWKWSKASEPLCSVQVMATRGHPDMISHSIFKARMSLSTSTTCTVPDAWSLSVADGVCCWLIVVPGSMLVRIGDFIHQHSSVTTPPDWRQTMDGAEVAPMGIPRMSPICETRSHAFQAWGNAVFGDNPTKTAWLCHKASESS